MKQLNDEQMDRIIKEKFKQDNIISDKANSVFANFNPQNMNQTENQAEEKTSIKEEINKANKNVMNALFYKRLNKFLSVAAVSLTVVLVSGTTLYFNKDKIKNNPKTENETSIYTKSFVIKNEPLHYSNEQVVKEVENHYVKAYLIGNSDVGVEFLHDYWDQINKEVVKVSSETYKIDGINGIIKDIFVGNAVNSAIPYLFVLMEDGTAMYVDLHGYYGYITDLYYYAVPLEGLTDIVGFEEKTRNFSYSRTEYTYVNAIRSDGKRKEIEIGEVNNWNDTSTKTFDKLNEKYIKAHNNEAIIDDNTGSFEVDGKTYYPGAVNTRYVYYNEWMSGGKLYRVERSTGKKELMATGINGISLNNSKGQLSVYVVEGEYIIYIIDENIVFRNLADESIINEVTSTKEEKNVVVDNNTTNETQNNITTNTTINNTVNTTTNNTTNSTSNNVTNNTTTTTNATNDTQKSQITTNNINSKAEVFKDLQAKIYVAQKVEPEYEYNENAEHYTCDYTLKFISADNFSIQINTKYKGKNVKIVIPNVDIEETSEVAGDTNTWFNLVGYDDNNKKYEGWGALSVDRKETPLLNLTIVIKEDLFEGVNVSIQGERLILDNSQN